MGEKVSVCIDYTPVTVALAYTQISCCYSRLYVCARARERERNQRKVQGAVLVERKGLCLSDRLSTLCGECLCGDSSLGGLLVYTSVCNFTGARDAATCRTFISGLFHIGGKQERSLVR